MALFISLGNLWFDIGGYYQFNIKNIKKKILNYTIHGGTALEQRKLSKNACKK